jgi:ribonuclease-3
LVIAKKAIQDEYLKTKIFSLLSSLQIENITDIEIFIQAFIHRSIVNERNDYAPEHNERLEFLGDAVLELVITEKLFLDYPEKQEGELTDMRSALVRWRNLAQVAKTLSFQEYLLLWKGEEKSGGREKDYILANTLEAFLGALYSVSGFNVAKEFILSHIYTTLPYILKHNLFKDFKTLLQEYTQATFDITPNYKVLAETGPDHDKVFEVGVYLDQKCIGSWEGSSKKKWQESAAQNAYNTLQSD